MRTRLRRILVQAYGARFQAENPFLAEYVARYLQPARLGTTVGEARVGINRRELQGEGPLILGENPSGAVDHEIHVIRFDELEGKPIATDFSHGCHPVTVGSKCILWSADYTGPTRARRGKKTSPSTFSFAAHAQKSETRWMSMCTQDRAVPRPSRHQSFPPFRCGLPSHKISFGGFAPKLFRRRPRGLQ